MGKSPIFGPVTARLVEYGIARLRNDHKGQIIEPLAFLSTMKRLETQGHLDLRSRPSCEESHRSAFEEAMVLYLLRQLRYPVSMRLEKGRVISAQETSM